MAARGAEDTPIDVLRRLLKTDSDPWVHQRAQAVLLVEQGRTLASVRLLELKPDRVRIWQQRFAAEGRARLLDRSRRGRPPALDEAASEFVEEALDNQIRALDRRISGLIETAQFATDSDARRDLAGQIDVLTQQKRNTEAERTKMAHMAAAWEREQERLESLTEQTTHAAAELATWGYAKSARRCWR